MKSFFHKYKFILFLAVFWVAMSLAGFLGQNTVYAGYSVDVRTTPYFVLVLQGIHDHIFPWSGSADDNLEPIAVQQYPKEHIRMTEPGQEAAPSDISEQEAEPGPEKKTFQEVGDDYFDDAVFIGDSRTEGMILNTGLWNTTAYVYKGLMVNTVFTKPVVNINGEKIPVMDALKSTNFSKVYIMLGINETGWAYSPVFQEKYKDIIDAVQEINPDAFIYIQGIIPVSDKVSSEHPYITNSKIAEYNRLLQELAEEKEVYFIDTKNAVMSTNGALPEDAATDGIHLVNVYCQKWLDYLKTHTVNE